MIPEANNVSFTLAEINGSGRALLIADDLETIEIPIHQLTKMTPSEPHLTIGTIYKISCQRDGLAEKSWRESFADLQDSIRKAWTVRPPSSHSLSLQEVTLSTTTVTWTSWTAIVTETETRAKLYTIECWCNGRLLNTGTSTNTDDRNAGPCRIGSLGAGIRGGIRAEETSLRLTGLDPDTQYSLHLVFRTSCGRLRTDPLVFRTAMADGVNSTNRSFSVTVDPSLGPRDRQRVVEQLQGLGAHVEADLDPDRTTHVVVESFQSPMASSAGRAGLPVISKEWVKVCHEAGRLVSITSFFDSK